MSNQPVFYLFGDVHAGEERIRILRHPRRPCRDVHSNDITVTELTKCTARWEDAFAGWTL